MNPFSLLLNLVSPKYWTENVDFQYFTVEHLIWVQTVNKREYKSV